jgi:hypothetical protein
VNPLPQHVAFRHLGAREGFEVAFINGKEVHGTTSAVESGEPWFVRYELDLQRIRARVSSRSSLGVFERLLESDGHGRWLVDGAPAPHLDGCEDVDLESSALTNAFAIRRMSLAVGQKREAPAAYVRALDLRVERLEQSYSRLPDVGGTQRFAYVAPAFGVSCELVFDASGVIIEYPGLAIRVTAS